MGMMAQTDSPLTPLWHCTCFRESAEVHVLCTFISGQTPCEVGMTVWNRKSEKLLDTTSELLILNMVVEIFPVISWHLQKTFSKNKKAEKWSCSHFSVGCTLWTTCGGNHNLSKHFWWAKTGDTSLSTGKGESLSLALLLSGELLSHTKAVVMK